MKRQVIRVAGQLPCCSHYMRQAACGQEVFPQAVKLPMAVKGEGLPASLRWLLRFSHEFITRGGLPFSSSEESFPMCDSRIPFGAPHYTKSTLTLLTQRIRHSVVRVVEQSRTRPSQSSFAGKAPSRAPPLQAARASKEAPSFFPVGVAQGAS